LRRIIIAFLLCLLCTACASEEEVLSPAIDFRAEVVQNGGCSFVAQVEADFGQTVQMFTLQCQTNENDELRFSVLAPETLAGISATVTEGGGTITYDGMAMDFGLLANGNVIPAAAPAIVSSCWTNAYIASAGNENSLYRATYEKNYDEKKLIVETWFEKGLPISAEICYNNERVIKITISDFSLN